MIIRLLLLLLANGISILFISRAIATLYASSRIYDVEGAPARRVAIVFGAGLYRDGSPTPILRDRVEAAAGLYFSGKVEKVLMSGDNRFVYYNEPAAMQAYALELGIPAKDIVLDFAGQRTYDTCYRARDIFGVRSAILVTQSFHLPRALYLCNWMGVDALGVESDLRVYRKSSQLFWNLRELLATLAALWEVHISHPRPILGNPEPIFPLEAQ